MFAKQRESLIRSFALVERFVQMWNTSHKAEIHYAELEAMVTQIF